MSHCALLNNIYIYIYIYIYINIYVHIYKCWDNWDVRVVDVEEPVQDKVDTERDVDEVGVVLSHALVHRGHAVDDLYDVHQLVVLTAQVVLVKGVYRVVHAQEVHCETGRVRWMVCGALSGGRWSRGWGTLVKGALGSRGGWGVGEIRVGVGEVRVYSRWGSWGGGDAGWIYLVLYGHKALTTVREG